MQVHRCVRLQSWSLPDHPLESERRSGQNRCGWKSTRFRAAVPTGGSHADGWTPLIQTALPDWKLRGNSWASVGWNQPFRVRWSQTWETPSSPKLHTSLVSTSTMHSIDSTGIHSNRLWKLYPPVERLGQGSPARLRRAPSVPPRTGWICGSIPQARNADTAWSTTSMCFSITGRML